MVAEAIGRGETIESTDLTTSFVAVDAPTQLYSAEQLEQIVGSVAATDLAPGDLVGPSTVTSGELAWHTEDGFAVPPLLTERDLTDLPHLVPAARDLLARRDDEQVLMVGHHPLISFGAHGGHFPLRDHIFPLRALNDKFYKSIDVLASIDAATAKLAQLFEALVRTPERLPVRFRNRIDEEGLERTVCDYVSGMTDRFVETLVVEL